MSSSDPVKNTSSPRHFQMGDPDPGSAASDATKSGVTQASPFQSLGERPEMELDLWEGQFNLSNLSMEQFTTSLSTEDLQKLLHLLGGRLSCYYGHGKKIGCAVFSTHFRRIFPVLSLTHAMFSFSTCRTKLEC